MQSAVAVWRRQKKDRIKLDKKGIVESWTTIHVAPVKFHDHTPYSIVLVKLESGERVYGQLVDFEESQLVIGQPVVSVLRTVGNVGPEELIEYGVKFKPSL